MTVWSVTDKAKLKNLVDTGVQILTDISTAKEGLKDDIEAVAEEMEIEKAILVEVIAISYASSQNKDKLTQKRDKLQAVEEILMAVGRA